VKKRGLNELADNRADPSRGCGLNPIGLSYFFALSAIATSRGNRRGLILH